MSNITRVGWKIYCVLMVANRVMSLKVLSNVFTKCFKNISETFPNFSISVDVFHNKRHLVYWSSQILICRKNLRLLI